MVNYFIYAKDFSLSTNQAKYYHENGLKTLDQFKKDVQEIKKGLKIVEELPTESKIVYLHWGYDCYEVDEETTRKTYKEQMGDEFATYPETIADWLQEHEIGGNENKIKLLYIITDGMIGEESVNDCLESNEDMQYETVVFHALNEDLTQINLSVATAFFKSRCVVYRNNRLYDSTNISEEFDYDKVNVKNFATERDQLKSYIKLKFINKFQQDVNSLQEISKLKKLRDRLFEELSSKTVESVSEVNLETKDRNEFLQKFVKTDWYKNLNTAVHLEKVDIEKSISALINYIVSDAKSYSFDALKFDKKFDKSVKKKELVDVDFLPDCEIEFPDIILDYDKGLPVVILTPFNLLDKIIFHKSRWSKQVTPASFSKFKSTMECPLFLVNDRDLSESIGYFYNLNVYKQLLANRTKTEPRTRKPFHGGLVLTDTSHFDKYNDYILSATYFNGKKVEYNVGLFYYVLWKNCENKEWMDRNVVEQFRKYAMRRISETMCNIGLSSLPLDPQERTTLLTALWYCVELSSGIFKNDPQHFKQERLRGYYSVARYMIEILTWFNYDLDLESIAKRRELLSYVMTLKKIQKRREKIYYLLEKIFKTVDGFLISEIERPSNLYKLNYLKLNHKGILRDDIVEEKVHLNDYVHLMHFEGDLDASKAGTGTFEICEKTFHPYFALDKDKSFYTELVKNTKKVVISNDDDKDKIEVTFEPINSLEFDRVLSLYKLFIDCVKESKKYPTLSEYVDYISKRKKFHGDLVTLFPSNVYFDIKDVYERYQKVVKNVGAKEFIKVCESHVERMERIKAEERVMFSSDSEISEFISNEEFKVKLNSNHTRKKK
nr:p94-like protein [Cotesia vestalis bracovirus]